MKPWDSIRIRLVKIWDVLGHSYWFLPAVMALAAAGLALGMLQLDRYVTESELESVGRWIYLGDADGARDLLSTVAGSIITVAGVVFSVTIVALTLAASQFGPRLLRTFMRDRGNQIVMGTFIGTYVYCILLLRTIRSGADGFVPGLAITLAIVLTLASLGVLIFFIHHIATSMRAPIVVASRGKEFERSIARLFSIDDSAVEEIDGRNGVLDAEADELNERLEAEGNAVLARKTGYVQAIDRNILLKIAEEHDLVLKLECRPGDFVSLGDPLLLALPASRAMPDLSDRHRSLFVLGSERTETQDVLFVLDELVQVAVRALSPSLNDPFTALTCIDWAGAGLARALGRRSQTVHLRDQDGRLRLLDHPVTFERLAEAAFTQIRLYGHSNVAICARLLEVIAGLVPYTASEEEREVLRRHAFMVQADSAESIIQPLDRETVRRRYDAIERALASVEG